MLISSFIIIAAIIVLYFGAEFTLHASEVIGRRLGLSPLVIGMVLIGFGTSLPEFFVAHIAAAKGDSGLAMGSLIGSNIANLFLILGLSGLFASLGVHGKSLREHLFIHLILGFVLVYVLNQPVLSILVCIPLLILLIVYLYFIFQDMKREKIKNLEKKLAEHHLPEEKDNMAVLIVKMILGFIMLYIGGELLVKGGTDLGLRLGISSYIISSIFVAFGTSFPELVTAILAAVKKKDTDLIIGNIVGSNLFNCAFILGSLGFYNFQITQDFNTEMIALVVAPLFLVLLNLFKKNFYRVSSISFLIGYGYIVSYWLKS